MGAVDKAQVNYQPGMEGKTCASCLHFQKPDKCEIVAGLISPEASCDLYQTAENVEDAMSQFMTGMPNGSA